MIQSMTGYGKAEVVLSGGKLTIEIRALNSKSADINIKSSLLPKDKDLVVRKMLGDALVRGTIDLFLNWEDGAEESAHQINPDVFHSYWQSAVKAMDAETVLTKTFLKDPGVGSILASGILRLPDVVDSKKADVITPENWPLVEAGIKEALKQICAYRATEGKALYADVTSRVDLILSYYNEVEALEGERIQSVRDKLSKAMQDLQVKADPSRFEQEMIFYLEKYDINEEKVRLRQHCKYFREVIDSEPYPGKKLGFIIQEMGREINTTGSKANHAGIQQLVVKMKDELEKIREQSMNIL
ncbi:MAG: YicC family protein [Bacteroidales bacterium]|nr:YicC family protein [Bacteroidales bacterium]